MVYTTEQMNAALSEIKDTMGARLAIINTCRAIARENWFDWDSEGAHQWIKAQLKSRKIWSEIQVEALTMLTMRQFLESRSV